MKPWTTLATVHTREGSLQLRQRGEREFLIVIDGRVLMTSSDRRSEEAVATLACAPIATRPAPRVLVGGLGMGYTLRSALDALPPRAQVVTAELTPAVETWCRGPLAPLTGGAVLDPRVRVVIDDVSRVITAAPAGHYDAIILDLYEGPHAATQAANNPFYSRGALDRQYAALARGGILSVWSEERDEAYVKRLAAAGFTVTVHRAGSSRTHTVYLGRRT